MRVQIPNNWGPRDYQKPAWNYLESGGRHCELIWPRRHGKDDVSLHRTCVAAFERAANYWHMLPKANQVRKAIWDAVNPRTGRKRIDEAFPRELRESTRDSDMFIKFRNGSTWQALGSDNFEGAIGSTPAGIVYSEWAQAHPSARGYLRPILTENNGWQIFITTPRGKNHAYKTFRAAQKNPNAFAELLTVDDTRLFTKAQLETERQEYVDTYGEDMGNSLFMQEYYCSFDAATLGAIWGAELTKLAQDGRYGKFPHNPDYPVYVAMDIGRTDATSIWFYQIIANELMIIDFLTDNFKDVDWYCGQLLGRDVNIDIVNDQIVVEIGNSNEAEHRQRYKYETINLPHDARAKRFGSKKTVEEQFREVFGWGKVNVLPAFSVQDSIKYVRQMLKKTRIDERCDDGFEALKAYQFEWDEDKKRFRDNPLHNWASDPGDGFRYVGLSWRYYEPEKEEVKSDNNDYEFDDDSEESWKTA